METETKTADAVETVQVTLSSRYGDSTYEVTLTPIPNGTDASLLKYAVKVGNVSFGTISQTTNYLGPTNRFGAASFANKPGVSKSRVEWTWTGKRQFSKYGMPDRQTALENLLDSDILSLPM